MKITIIIPAHNEAEYIGQTLNSLVNQSLRPHQLMVVDDNSTDTTSGIVKEYTSSHPWIKLIHIKSSEKHLPGSKIVNAFKEGIKHVGTDYDLICKFDADLIFPRDYLKTIADHYLSNPKVGMAGGFCTIKRGEEWVLENLTRRDHIRGALKCYRKSCFEQIGGLKPAMGWDTVDELLAANYGWEVLTDSTLLVKHLKPTGKAYNRDAKLLQGEAMYRMRYGLVITIISSVKLALRKRNIHLLWDYLSGYKNARLRQVPFLVTKHQGVFIRKKRWQGIRKKLF